MKSAYFTIHPGKNPPLQNCCRLKSVFFQKHQFHILHFPNSTRLFTKPTTHHYTKYGSPKTLSSVLRMTYMHIIGRYVEESFASHSNGFGT